MKSIPMRQAKPTPDDLKMAKDLCGAFDDICAGYLPNADGEEPEGTVDIENDEEAANALRALLEIFSRGNLDRCVWTLSMLMDPANAVVDPDLCYVALHPRLTNATTPEPDCAVESTLREAVEAALEYMPSSTVQNWPPGYRLKREAIQKCRDALRAAERGDGKP